MKVLTLNEYWASLMANGFKRVETRKWETRHRGPFLNHAAKGFPSECRELISRPTFAEMLGSCTPPIISSADVTFTLGRVLSRHDLVDCVPTRWLLESGEARAKEYRSELGIGSIAGGGSRQHELEFGDYSDGRFAWITRGLKRASRPFLPPAGGFHRGLWNLPDDWIQRHAPELLT